MEVYIIPLAIAMTTLIIVLLIRKYLKGKRTPIIDKDITTLQKENEELLLANDELSQKNQILIGAIKEREERLKAQSDSHRAFIVSLKDANQANLIAQADRHSKEKSDLFEHFSNVMLQWKEKIQAVYQNKFNSFQETKGMEFTKMMIHSALSITADEESVDYQSLEEMMKEKEALHKEEWDRKLEEVITESHSISDSLVAEMKVQEAKISEKFAHQEKDTKVAFVQEEADRKIADASLDNKIIIEKEQRVASDNEITINMASGFQKLESRIDKGLLTLKNYVDSGLNEMGHRVKDMYHGLTGAIKDIDIKHSLNYENLTSKFESYKNGYQELLNRIIHTAQQAEINNSRTEHVLDKVNHQYEVFKAEKGHFKKEFENAVAEISVVEGATANRLVSIINELESNAYHVQDKIRELFSSKLSLEAQANNLEASKKVLFSDLKNKEADLKRLQDKIDQENRHQKDMHTKDQAYTNARTKDLTKISMLESDVRRGRERYDSLSNRLAFVNRMKRA